MFHAAADGYPAWHVFVRQYAWGFAHPWDMVTGVVELSRLAEARMDGWRIGGYWIVPLWILEFLLLVGFSRSQGKAAALLPFCEKSGTWTVDYTLPQKFAPVHYSEPLKALISANPACIAALFQPRLDQSTSDYAEVTIHRCRAGDAYLSVSDWTRTYLIPSADRHEFPRLTHQRLAGIDVDVLVRALERRAAQPPGVRMAEWSRRPTPSELSQALGRLQESDHAMALTLASPHVRSAKPALRRDAARLCALAAGGLGRWAEARLHWLEVFDDDPGAHAALQVATSSVMAGDVAQGEVWFDSARILNYDSEEFLWPAMLLNFLTVLNYRGEVHASLKYAQALRDIYADVESTDAANECLDGMPPFRDFLRDSLPIVQAALPAYQWRAWYETLRESIDERGRRQLNAWLAEHLLPAV